MNKRVWAGLVFGVVASMCVVAGPVAAGGGNSDNAKLCQKGGWQTFFRENGSTFGNQGQCVSYAAQGNTLLDDDPFAEARALCASLDNGAFTHPEGFWWRCDAGSTPIDTWRYLAVDLCALTYAGRQGGSTYGPTAMFVQCAPLS